MSAVDGEAELSGCGWGRAEAYLAVEQVHLHGVVFVDFLIRVEELLLEGQDLVGLDALLREGQLVLQPVFLVLQPAAQIGVALLFLPLDAAGGGGARVGGLALIGNKGVLLVVLNPDAVAHRSHNGTQRLALVNLQQPKTVRGRRRGALRCTTGRGAAPQNHKEGASSTHDNGAETLATINQFDLECALPLAHLQRLLRVVPTQQD
jgi:hypothetical protein